MIASSLISRCLLIFRSEIASWWWEKEHCQSSHYPNAFFRFVHLLVHRWDLNSSCCTPGQSVYWHIYFESDWIFRCDLLDICDWNY
jgi:hypothetical protein